MAATAESFEDLVAPFRGELHAHCHRMLGSAADAEDALQETLLRAWRGLDAFEGRSTLRSWLYTIATNVCLRAIERRPREPDPYPDDWAQVPDGRATPDARFEQREAVELAFVAAVQHLPGRQRAVLLLRDVLGFTRAEIAPILDTSASAVSSTLQRARQAADERLPEHGQQAALRSLSDDVLRDMVRRYVEAWESGDVAGVVALLADDAVFSMPPRPESYRGRREIGAFLAANPLAGHRRWRLVELRASGQLAFGTYLRDQGGGWELHAIDALTLGPDGRISALTASLGTVDHGRFGIPPRLTD